MWLFLFTWIKFPLQVLFVLFWNNIIFHELNLVLLINFYLNITARFERILSGIQSGPNPFLQDPGMY